MSLSESPRIQVNVARRCGSLAFSYPTLLQLLTSANGHDRRSVSVRVMTELKVLRTRDAQFGRAQNDANDPTATCVAQGVAAQIDLGTPFAGRNSLFDWLS